MSHFFFLKRGLSLALNSPSRIGRLASKPDPLVPDSQHWDYKCRPPLTALVCLFSHVFWPSNSGSYNCKTTILRVELCLHNHTGVVFKMYFLNTLRESMKVHRTRTLTPKSLKFGEDNSCENNQL